jgi:hypothetical protein
MRAHFRRTFLKRGAIGGKRFLKNKIKKYSIEKSNMIDDKVSMKEYYIRFSF